MGFYDYAGDPNNYPGNVQLPLDNEKPKFSTAFAPGYEGALDRTAWLKARVDGLIAMPRFGGPVIRDGAWNLFPVIGANLALRYQADISNGGDMAEAIYWPLLLPHGFDVLSYGVIVEHEDAHGAVPANKQKIGIWRLPSPNSATTGIPANDTGEEIDSLVDPANTVGNYDVKHVLRKSSGGPIFTIDGEYLYFLFVQNESGANSDPDSLIVHSPRCFVELTP